jgi:hypothetical protein
MRDAELCLLPPRLRSSPHRHVGNVQTKAGDRSPFFTASIQTFTPDW